MKIIISQQERRLPPFFFTQDALERGWYRLLAGHDICPVPNIPDFDFESMQFDCLILSGGNDSVDRHLTEDRLYALAESRALPIIGVCHGAFAVNDLAGGRNAQITGHVDQDHVIRMDSQEFEVNSYHGQCIEQLPPGFEPVAHDLSGVIECFRHIFRPTWGVVWHPERQRQPVLPQDLAEFLHTDQSPWQI